ncbi:hypothetical protein GGTG_09620 [Gaeumannomyces tritici R3-111a-1]|uniref:Transcription factor Pcc1 n=1 Tax=Gaeumannomyces tritici (strain R3-111a-1) TaxID=644352 RepID=J3P7Y0_GAET3|nr:hypothetical protein GGTG_09620 [Gaeumannomyces tritici R3-111a-1]EJT72763.1 hypothetical protein GGTG_09620 [Gaeumannomyces tritici R3-111a-1]
MADNTPSLEFPCALTIDVPFPTARLASVALGALAVDKELSPLVHRSFSTVVAESQQQQQHDEEAEKTVLRTEYSAATNRMLRVAVNSFMDSLSLVLEVMEQLDVDVLETTLAKKAT